MGLFGGSKVKAKEDSGIPESSDFPLKAYVYRLQPERLGKIQLAGRIQGDYDGFTTPPELEDMVAKLNGGGTYRCKCVKSGETKTHIGYHNFTVPGAPLIDGEEIDQDKEVKRREEHNRVNKIEEEIEQEEAAARLDEVRARRRAKQKQLGLIDDEDDDDDVGSSVAQLQTANYESPDVVAMKAQLKALEQKLEEKDRQSLMEKHQMEMKALRDEMTHRMEQIQLQSNSKKDGGTGEIIAAQMKAVEAMLQAGQQQTQAMLNSNTELIKAMLGRDPTAGTNERIDKLIERLLNSNSSNGKEVMEVMKESFNTGIMMARGGEQAPTSMADVAREFSTGVLGVVGKFMEQKGSMSKEVLAQEIQKATRNVVNDIKRRMMPTPLSHQRGQLAGGGVPAGQAMPSNAQPAEPAQGQGALTVEELRARVDKVMETFIDDMTNNTENWQEVALRLIPRSELERIGEFNFNNVAQYAMTHGSPLVVQKVIAKFQEIGLIDDEQGQMIAAGTQGGGQPAEPPAPAQEQGGEAFSQSDDEDDSLMGGAEPIEQGQQIQPEPTDSQPAVVASQSSEPEGEASKPKKRSRKKKA